MTPEQMQNPYHDEQVTAVEAEAARLNKIIEDRDRFQDALKRMVPYEHPDWVQSSSQMEEIAREALGLPEARC